MGPNSAEHFALATEVVWDIFQSHIEVAFLKITPEKVSVCSS